MDTLLNVVRYDTYAGLSTGSTNGISVRENPGGKGEIVFTPAVSLTHTSSDVSGSYSGGRYHWDQLISPCYETTARFATFGQVSGNGRSGLRCWVVYCPSTVPLAFRGVLA
jgi:hypothetical protein